MCSLCVLQNAVSVFCRLGFAKKKSLSTEMGNSEAVHHSWKNIEQQNIITKKSVVMMLFFVSCLLDFHCQLVCMCCLDCTKTDSLL